MMMNAMRYGEWLVRGLVVLLFTLAGAMKLTAHPFELRGFAHFGYELWFMYLIGALELGCAFALLQVRLILPAAGLLTMILAGAIASHMLVGDPLQAAAPALIALTMLAVLAIIHRPSHP